MADPLVALWYMHEEQIAKLKRAAEAQVKEFAARHRHFEKRRLKMARLIERGKARTLLGAYRMAGAR